VSFFSRRTTGTRKLRKRLDGDMHAVRDLAERYGGADGDGSFDLLAFTIRAFELGSTDDVDHLISRGVDGSEFFLRELKPNWRGLTREERATRIASFVRFANLLDKSEPNGDSDGPSDGVSELCAGVRTKIVLLASAYDVSYGDDYCRRIAKNPQRFGEYDMPGALAHT
jgi:hypothetical protein